VISYEATEGGSVSASEETIDLSDEAAAPAGATATADEGYTFVNWTRKADDSVVSEDATFVPEEIEEATYVANFEEVKKPEVTLDKIDYIIPIIAILVICAFFFRLVIIYSGYRAGEKEYNQLQSQVISKDGGTSEEGISNAEEQGKDPKLQIDFTKLRKINEDVVAWIYYEPLDISYPVVQGKDNEHYVHYTFENEKNTMASIFMDYRNNADFSDYNTIIYGHNMKNGSMFGSLKKLSQEPAICEDNPYIYIYIEGKAQKYQIFALCSIKATSDIYELMQDEPSYMKYKELVHANANYYKEVDESVLAQDRILLLSTCSGSNSIRRLVVCAVPVNMDK